MDPLDPSTFSNDIQGLKAATVLSATLFEASVKNRQAEAAEEANPVTEQDVVVIAGFTALLAQCTLINRKLDLLAKGTVGIAAAALGEALPNPVDTPEQ